VVFVANEYHYHGASPLTPTLRVDGESAYEPSQTIVLNEDGHHLRTSIWVFDAVPASEIESTHTLEIVLPPTIGGESDMLTWDTPLD
jgi:hypothetical protein